MCVCFRNSSSDRMKEDRSIKIKIADIHSYPLQDRRKPSTRKETTVKKEMERCDVREETRDGRDG